MASPIPAAPPVTTYAGTVLNREGATARFTIDERGLQGLIVDGEERVFVEPLSSYTLAAGPTDYLIYRASDVRPEAAPGACATTAAQRIAGAVESVAEEVENFLVDATARQAAPLVASMHEAAEQVRAAELERFASRIASLDDTQRDAVDALTRAIVAKLLHEPSVRLKSQAGTPQGERNAAALRDLFDIG